MSKSAPLPKIVVVGGGTGTSLVLRGLKKYPVSLGAVISTSDSGGSSGVLRDEFDMVPPGDVRQCFVALNEDKNRFLDFFHRRFTKGGLKGHAFGNTFFALLSQEDDDFCDVVKKAEQVVAAEHRIFPVTHTKTDLVAVLSNGETIRGQFDIVQIDTLHKILKTLSVSPSTVSVNQEAKDAIQQADMIVLGPGNLVASLSPPLLVEGILDAVRASSAKKVFITNLFNQGTTQGFGVDDYLRYFEKHIGTLFFDVVLYNTEQVSPERLQRWGLESAVVGMDTKRESLRYIGAPLVDVSDFAAVPGDPVVRTPIRHDKDTVAKILYELVTE